MDSYEFNKIAGGVLATALFVVGIRAIGEEIYKEAEPERPAIEVASAAPPAGAPASAGAAPAAAPPAEMPDFAAAIPAADAMAGETVAERCMVCHDIGKDGMNKIGPVLYGVVGRAKASFAGFDYSAAMKEKGGNWTYAELYQFLQAPLTNTPGTKMTFAGIPRAQDRLNLIAYLRNQADSPAPLP
jgi:cytochrome c